jgi:glyoxylase-like metal-dependent hydrolase (beta-lactamase superfamily II)
MESVPKIHTHMSGEKGIFANAYLIESQSGVVVIDSTLTESESKAVRSEIVSINKPLLAIILTHPHPDHVAGVTNLVHSSSDTPIIALKSVDDLIRSSEEFKRAYWTPVFKDEWISKWTPPNRHMKDEEEVIFDGIRYTVHDIGAGGDSDSNSIWIIENEPKVAFVGDLIYNGIHSYIADNHIQDWLKNLDKVKGLLSDISTIYPGHGKPGNIDLLESQKKYLSAYQDAVKAISNNGKLIDEDKKRLTAIMEEFLPKAGLTWVIAHSADAVAAELSAKK